MTDNNHSMALRPNINSVIDGQTLTRGQYRKLISAVLNYSTI